MPGYLHHHASSTSQHVLCIQEIMTYHRLPLYAPLSPLLCCMSPKSLMTRASLSVWTLMMDAHSDEGKIQQNPFTPTIHTHRDAQSNTVPVKQVAVYMYSISTMYSLRCCNLHVDL